VSDYIIDRDGNRITAKQVDAMHRALKIISVWCEFQCKKPVESDAKVIADIARLVKTTFGELK